MEVRQARNEVKACVEEVEAGSHVNAVTRSERGKLGAGYWSEQPL